MPPRRDIYSPFSDPNSFLGRPFLPAVGSALTSGAGSIARGEEEFRRSVLDAGSRALSDLGRTAMTIGSAYTAPITAARRAVSGTPLISGTALGRPRQQQPAEQVVAPPVTAFSQPSAPQPAAPAFPSVAAPMPSTQSAASVGQNLVTQQPIRNPVLPATLTQNRVIPETTPSIRPIQTPYGTIYASNVAQQQGMPTQAETFASRTTAFEGRAPEQQQALLAQVRQNGQRIASNYAQTMGTFAESRGARFASVPAPQGLYGQPLVQNFPQSREAIAQRTTRSAPTLAATGFGQMQQEQQRQTMFGLGRNPLYSGMGIGAALTGGPQPSTSLFAENRRRIFPSFLG